MLPEIRVQTPDHLVPESCLFRLRELRPCRTESRLSLSSPLRGVPQTVCILPEHLIPGSDRIANLRPEAAPDLVPDSRRVPDLAEARVRAIRLTQEPHYAVMSALLCGR